MLSRFCVLDSCLVCLRNEIHAAPLLCPGFLSGLSSVFWVKFMRSHSCVLGSCLVCLLGQLHAVLLPCLGFLFVMFFGKILAVIFLFRGSCIICLPVQIHALIPLYPIFLSALSDELSQEYSSRGPTPVSWVLVWYVFRVKFMRSYSCVLGSCLVCLLNEIHAVPLLCPGFLSSLSCGSASDVLTPVSWVLVWFVLWVKFTQSHSCAVSLFCLMSQLHAVPLLCPGFLFARSCGSTSCCSTPVFWVVVWLALWLKFMRSHSSVLGSCLVCLMDRSTSCSSCLICLKGQVHAVPLLSSEFLSGLSSGSTSCVPTPVSWVLVWFIFRVKFMRPYSCVLGSCLVVFWVNFMRSRSFVLGSCLVGFLGQLHAVPLLSSEFLSGFSYGSNSCGPTPACWVLVWFVLCIDQLHAVPLICLMGQIHAALLLCPGFLSGLSSGSTSCCPTPVSWVVVWFVLGCCLVCLMGQLHAVPLLCAEFLSVCLMGQLHAIPLLCPGFFSGLSYGSDSCGPLPVSWVLVCFALGIQFMRSHSCVLGYCLFCLMGQLHAVPLLCPGLLAGLSYGSISCGPTPVSWVLVWLVSWVKFRLFHSCLLNSCLVCLLGQIRAVPLLCVLWVNFMRPHSCVLCSCLVCLLSEIHAVPLLCLGFLSGLSYGWQS